MTKKQPAEIPFAARNISELDPNFLVDLRTACCILTRSRASLYRDIAAGHLELVKVGRSSRLRVGAVRKLMGAI